MYREFVFWQCDSLLITAPETGYWIHLKSITNDTFIYLVSWQTCPQMSNIKTHLYLHEMRRHGESAMTAEVLSHLSAPCSNIQLLSRKHTAHFSGLFEFLDKFLILKLGIEKRCSNKKIVHVFMMWQAALTAQLSHVNFFTQLIILSDLIVVKIFFNIIPGQCQQLRIWGKWLLSNWIWKAVANLNTGSKGRPVF